MEYGEYLAHRAGGGRKQGRLKRADDFVNGASKTVRNKYRDAMDGLREKEKEEYQKRKEFRDKLRGTVDGAVEDAKNKKRNADAAKKKKRNRAVRNLVNLISGRTKRV